VVLLFPLLSVAVKVIEPLRPGLGLELLPVIVNVAPVEDGVNVICEVLKPATPAGKEVGALTSTLPL
jgi:hypothetical protein